MALIACPECNAEVSDRAPACPRCGYPFSTDSQALVTVDPAEDERRRAFEAQIAHLVTRGFRVVSQTDTTAQLVRPKTFSFVWATLWFLVCGVGVLVYLFWYAAKRDEVVYLNIANIDPTRSTGTPGGGCPSCGRRGAPGRRICKGCGAQLPVSS